MKKAEDKFIFGGKHPLFKCEVNNISLKVAAMMERRDSFLWKN